ncbi:MAG: alkyl sulfatase dimerization domain-containing protein [Alcanivoracaceae bacterium]|nr:alkyl sulfatase dimerization domain-containing protein [Alcanivoracaceae bacterium]
MTRSLLITLMAATALLGCDQAAPPVSQEYQLHPELAEHTSHFDKQVYQIGERIYSAVGWNLANTIMIEGDDGLIIIDVGESTPQSEQVMAEFRRITDKPVKAVIYTHHHPDHINGTAAFVSAQQVERGEVEIIAHESLVEHVVMQGATVGPILSLRSGYSFGVALAIESPDEMVGMNGGIGPTPVVDLENDPGSTFIPPTRTFSDEAELRIAGVLMQMVHVPSEAEDEIAIWLPEENILLSAEVIQGPTLPNIHTLRGTKFRDPVQWVRALDKLRSFRAQAMVPSHGQPVIGAENVEQVLRMTRDGIAYIHDQTIRYMNKGYTPDELVELVKFPPHLRDYGPYLREYYGTVKHAVRQIYNGYLGWFDGDPTTLDPTPPLEKAQRMVAMMGGRDQVMQAANDAFSSGDYQWAAELLTPVVRINHDDMEARRIKAAALRKLGYASMNINWRNWYLTSAMELEGELDVAALAEGMKRPFMSITMMQNFPPMVWLNGMALHLDADKAEDTELVVAFEFADINAYHAVEVRRGVAQVHENVADDLPVSATLSMEKAFLDRVLAGEAGLIRGIASGDVQLKGSKLDVVKFLSLLDPQDIGDQGLTVR